MEKVLSSAQAQAEITKLEARKSEIEKANEELRNDFENQNVEERDATLTKVEGNQNELSNIDKQIDELNKRKEKLEDEERFMNLQAKLEKPEVRKVNDYDTPEYRGAYVKALKGDDSELRALSTTLENAPIPNYLQERIETAWDKYGDFLRLCGVSHIKGTLTVPYEKTASDAELRTEGSAATEGTITLGEVTLKASSVTEWFSMTVELEAMTSEEFMDYIADIIVYKIVCKVEEQIIAGAKGTQGIVGVVNSDLTKSVELNADFNTLNMAQIDLGDKVNNIVCVMNKKTFFGTFLALKDTAGRPIFTVMNDNTGKPRYFISGVPVVFANVLKDYGTAVAKTDAYMLVGSFDAFRINAPLGTGKEIGITFTYDPFTLATEGKKRVIGNAIVAGGVVKPASFVKVAKSA